MNLFRNLEPIDLTTGFQKMTEKLLIIPNTYDSYSITGCLNYPTEYFLQFMSVIEKLFFMDELDKRHTYNAIIYKRRQTLEHYASQFFIDDLKTGFLYNMDASTAYEENAQAKHLPVAEEQFKVTPTQFLKIYTIEELLVVETNKELPFSTIIKLKLLQLKLAEKHIKTPQPLIFDFLNALLEEDLDKVNQIANQIINMEELQEIKYKALDEAFQPDYSQRIQDLEYAIEQYEEKYLRKQNELSSLVQKICNAQEDYEMLTTRANNKNDNTILLNFLKNHPYIKEVNKKSTSTVSLYYEAPILYFDDFIIKRIMKNYGKDKQTVCEIILDKKYELMVRTEIDFNTETFYINPVRIGADNFIGHPHLDEYHCVGNHDMYIHECRRTNDYLGAIEQITGAVLNINFSDGVVVKTMLEKLMGDNRNRKTWRNKETGELKTTLEVLEEYENEKATTE